MTTTAVRGLQLQRRRGRPLGASAQLRPRKSLAHIAVLKLLMAIPGAMPKYGRAPKSARENSQRVDGVPQVSMTGRAKSKGGGASAAS